MINRIEEMVCPHCGCNDIEEEARKHQHTNGYWNEYRGFKCGMKFHFSPNFMCTQVESECERNPLFKKVIDSRKQALKRVQNYVGKLKVDTEYRDRLLGELKHTGTTYPPFNVRKLFPEEFV